MSRSVCGSPKQVPSAANAPSMCSKIKKVCGNVKKGRVTIACSLAKTYGTYQLRNRPSTVDLAKSLVMGRPFGGQFLDGIVRLCKNIESVFAPYEKVRLMAYGRSHLHATVNPVVRTEFIKELYEDTAHEMVLRQLQEIMSKDIDPASIREQVEQTAPFEIDVSSGEVEINGRGEVLLRGDAREGKSRQDLADLRKRLAEEAGLHPWDKGSKIHVTVATIEDFHELKRPEKVEIAGRIEDCLTSVALGTTLVDRVKLVFYSHRSLSREVCSEEMDLARGLNKESTQT